MFSRKQAIFAGTYAVSVSLSIRIIVVVNSKSTGRLAKTNKLLKGFENPT